MVEVGSTGVIVICSYNTQIFHTVSKSSALCQVVARRRSFVLVYVVANTCEVCWSYFLLLYHSSSDKQISNQITSSNLKSFRKMR